MTEVSDELKIVGIGKDISYIQKDIAEIKQSVKDLSNVYATQMALDAVKKDVDRMKDANALWRWLSPTISAALTAGVTFLVVFYFQHL